MYIRNKKTKSGFTLIELLVVIAIIGVLATIVLASLNSARRKSRDARRVTDIKQIGLALQLYYDGVGSSQYPLADGGATACADSDYGLRTLVTSGYIPTIPHDPSDPTACYRYASGSIDSKISTYHLGAILEDPANAALSNDVDCDDNIAFGTAGTCDVEVAATWAGAKSNGVESVNCTDASGGAGTDLCYDVKP